MILENEPLPPSKEIAYTSCDVYLQVSLMEASLKFQGNLKQHGVERQSIKSGKMLRALPGVTTWKIRKQDKRKSEK